MDFARTFASVAADPQASGLLHDAYAFASALGFGAEDVDKLAKEYIFRSRPPPAGNFVEVGPGQPKASRAAKANPWTGREELHLVVGRRTCTYSERRRIPGPKKGCSSPPRSRERRREMQR